MNSTLALNGLWAVPILVYLYLRRHLSSHKWALTGVSLGVVVTPASLGAYALGYVGGMFSPILAAICMPIMLLGLALTLFHGSLPFDIAVKTKIVEATSASVGISQLYLALIEALVWGPIYGLIGWGADIFISKRSK